MQNNASCPDVRSMKRLKKKVKTKSYKSYDVLNRFSTFLPPIVRKEDELMAKVRRISKQAREIYKNIENVENGDHDIIHDCQIPSTPHYSDSSYQPTVKHPLVLPKHENRYRVLLIASLTFFVQTYSSNIWTPLFEPALIAFPAWSHTSFSLYPIWNTIMGMFLVIPVSISINKYGIKKSLLYSCLASIIGTALRCLPIVADSMLIFHVSTVFSSSALVLIKPLTVTISTCCFRSGERNTASGIMTVASMASPAASLLITFVLRDVSWTVVPSTSTKWKIVITHIMVGCFFLNCLCTLLVYFVFPQESMSERCESFVAKKTFVPSKSSLIKTASSESGLVLVALSYACANAYSWPWFQMIVITYSRIGLSKKMGDDCRLWMIVHTCALTLSIGLFADRWSDSKKRLALICHILGFVFLLWIVLTLNFKILPQNSTNLMISVMFAFPLSWASQGLLFELAADNAHPLPENMAIGLVELLKIMCENFVYFLTAVLPEFHLYWMHIFTLMASFLSIIFLVLLKEKKLCKY